MIPWISATTTATYQQGLNYHPKRIHAQHDRRGHVMVLFVVLFIAFIAIFAFALDLGRAALARTELQASADAAVLAGADLLYDTNGGYTPDHAIQAAEAFFDHNVMANTLGNSATAPEDDGGFSQDNGEKAVFSSGMQRSHIIKRDIKLGRWSFDESTAQMRFTEIDRAGVTNALLIESQSINQATFFAKALGTDSMSGGAQATACIDRGEFDIYLLIDVTGSMKDDSRRGAMIGAVRDAIRHVAEWHPQDQVGIILFRETAWVAGEMRRWPMNSEGPKIPIQSRIPAPVPEPNGDGVGYLSGDFRYLLDQVAIPHYLDPYVYEGHGRTGTGAAIIRAANLLIDDDPGQREDAGKMIVILTDGVTDRPKPTTEATEHSLRAASSAAEAGVLIHGLAFNASLPAVHHLQKLTETSKGGQLRFVPLDNDAPENLSDTLKELIDSRWKPSTLVD